MSREFFPGSRRRALTQSRQALVEPRIGAQTIPLRRNGEMNQSGVVGFHGLLQVLKGSIHVSSLAIKNRQLHCWKSLRLAGRALENVPDHALTSPGGMRLLERFKGGRGDAVRFGVL